MSKKKKVFKTEVLKKLPEGYKGFGIAPSYMLKDPKLSFGAKTLYSLLMTYCIDKPYCYPTQKRIAKDLNCSDRNVRNYIKELKETGYISISPTKTGTGIRNVYHIIEFDHTDNYTQIMHDYASNEGEFESETDDLISGGCGTYFPEGSGTFLPEGCGTFLPGKYTNNKYTNNKYTKNNISFNKDIRVSDETHLSRKSKNNNLTTKQLFSTKDSEITYLENKLKDLNKNKHRLKCSKLRIRLAKLTGDWEEVTFRDFAYYFKHVMYLEKYGNIMKADYHFTTQLKQLFSHLNIKRSQFIDVLQDILDNYDSVSTEQYPCVSQGLFRQLWLVDRILSSNSTDTQVEEDKMTPEEWAALGDRIIAENGYDPDEVF